MSLIDETYVCPVCGWKFTVWRRTARKRSLTHKKWLYCLKCDKKRDFIRDEVIGRVVS